MKEARGSEGPPPALVATGVWKSYPGVQALRGVDFAVRRGEIHALIGENGAGKSTLMGVCSGSVQPESGTVVISQRTLARAEPAVARALGLAVVFQDDSLVPDLDVAQNLLLAAAPDLRPSYNDRHEWARQQLALFEAPIDPSSAVRDLSVATRQMVEIAKALASNPDVLVLDEPTASLAENEVEHLFAVLRDRVADGLTVVYITHRLREVFALARRVTVMRDGVVVAGDLSVDAAEEDRLVSLMVGSPIKTAFPAKAGRRGLPTLEVTGLSSAAFGPIEFTGYAGEIVGLAGIEGNGQREILRALSGLEPREGSVVVGGRTIRAQDVRSARDSGMEFISGDRRGEALFMGLGVRENLTVASLPLFAERGLISLRQERMAVAGKESALSLRISGPEQPVAELSGGNQQKVSIGRSLISKPRVFLLEEPTQGVDAGSRMEIYRLLALAAEDGAHLLVVSSDAVELAGLCDRVLVISRGVVVEELSGPALSEDAVVGAAVRAHVGRSAAPERPSAASAALRFLQTSDFAPVLLLLVSILAIMAAVGAAQPLFLSGTNLSNLMFLAVPLGFVALGQAAVMLSGGIDLSVGPLVALATVAVAQVIAVEPSAFSTLVAVGAALGVGAIVGLVNGLLVVRVGLLPLIATLATYIFIQGLALFWSPNPGGNVTREFTDSATSQIGIVPWPFLVLVMLAVAGEVVYRRTRLGLAYRSVGSRPTAAHRIGVPVDAIRYASYVAAAVLAAVGGVFFTATIGLGEPSLGVSFTLTSITAVVLGGLSTWGGRGSILGPLLGALVLAVLANSFAFLNWPSELQLMAQGGLMLAAIAVYSRLRGVGSHRDDKAGA